MLVQLSAKVDVQVSDTVSPSVIDAGLAESDTVGADNTNVSIASAVVSPYGVAQRSWYEVITFVFNPE